MKRRSFLKNTAAFSLPAFLGGFEAAAFPAQTLRSLIGDETDKVLVLIDLSGGNDGLNTFVPLEHYSNLHRARPKVVIPEKYLLEINDTLGMHPKMRQMHNMYGEGKISIVQSVGYPNQNRSHFRSADIWNTAVEADEFASTGWMGRYLDEQYPGYPLNYPNVDFTDPFAISMGKSISQTCQGANSNFSMAIIDTNNLGGLNTGVEGELTDDYYGEELGFLIETFKKTNAYADRVISAANVGSSSVEYPNTQLGRELKTVAKMISGGLQTKVYVLKLGGFDTHANQVEEGTPLGGWHSHLLETLSNAIAAFQDDLEKLGLEDRVLGMTFSEFGRKIKANAGFGTDHGTAAPLIFFGSCLNAGVIGKNPLIPGSVDPDEGVPMQYDFKSVYGSVLIDWFGAEEESVKRLLTEDFQHIPIVGNCRIVSPFVDLAVSAYPNPFVQSFSLVFNTFQRSTVSAQIFDVTGRVIQRIDTQEYPTGEYTLELGGRLAPGSYYIRVRIDDNVKTLRVVKV